MLFFPLPWWFLDTAAWAANKVLPRQYHFGEPLKMLAEDNVGDCAPVEHDLHVTFRPFF